MRPFDYVRARSVKDAAARAMGDAKFLSGGMTLLPAMKHGLAAPGTLVDLGGLASLRGVAEEGGELVIGALTTHAEVAASPLVHSRLPALAALAGGIGDAQVRHRGTLGGSVANNDPAADYPAGCVGLGATVVTDRRRLPAERFFTGFFSTALAPGELVTAVRFPLPSRAGYAKFANPASRYAMVGVFVAQTAEGVRVAVTGAGRDGVFRVPSAERALQERYVPEGLPPHGIPEAALIADLHASTAYRSHLLQSMLRRAVAASLGLPVRAPMRHGGAVAY